jgi:hypothetical protein
MLCERYHRETEVMQELCGVSTLNLKKVDHAVACSPRKSSAIGKVMEVHGKYWRVFGSQ